MDEMRIGCYRRHLLSIGTRHCPGTMIAGRHLHLGLAETTIDGTTVEVATAVLVASRHLPPPGGIVGAATRSRGRHLVARSRSPPRRENARDRDYSRDYDRSREMIDGTDAGIAGVDEVVHSLEASALRVCIVSLCFICVSPCS